MKQGLVRILVVSFISYATISHAGHGMGKGVGHQFNNGKVISTSSIPPGLSKHHRYPYGLSKKHKTPAGWKKGNKEGWNLDSKNPVTNHINKK